MSRTSTATPPPTYFPHRHATPTMRHGAPASKNGLFKGRHSLSMRKPKHSTGIPDIDAKQAPVASDGQALGLALDEIPLGRDNIDGLFDSNTDDVRSHETSSVIDDLPEVDSQMTESVSAPSMTSSSSDSLVSTPLPTPTSSRAPSLLQPEIVSDDVSMNEGSELIAPQPRSSWVPYFGKMAKAVVNTGINMGQPFFEKKKKDVAGQSIPGDANFHPTGSTSAPTLEELSRLPQEAATERRNAWAAEQQQRVTECARLCSQWPQSGYNQSKWGPNGSRQYYEPQSYANPSFVAHLMARQADLERQLCQTSGLHFSCYRQGSPSQDTEDSDESSLSSRADSMTLSADLSAAIDSPMMQPAHGEGFLTASPRSLSPPRSLKAAPSVSELDAFADSMAIDAPTMDVDRMTESTPAISNIHAQSCGFKRPLATTGEEEDKRRRVEEAMVVDEAIESGVIAPKQAIARPLHSDGRPLSASVPDLSSTRTSRSAVPAVFGHFVKTSDTHPIIISPFFPSELIPTISRHIVVPGFVSKSAPLLLASKIDVLSLLISFNASPKHINTLVPSPVQSSFQTLGAGKVGVQLGNLLLSSCPGKRLRMDGPVKGRGPVCRDLATDLRRIKNEGVGCLVCCLDDNELALLGVPWETYRHVAHEIGLDVIRYIHLPRGLTFRSRHSLPMPDGFTPVSIPLFDSQISLIVNEYSLKGINILVHCRGGVGRAGLTACGWAIKMGFAAPHPSLAVVEDAVIRRAVTVEGKTAAEAKGVDPPAALEHQIVMSVVERAIAMIRARRGLKAIESFEQVQFLASYTRWLRASIRESIRDGHSTERI